MKRLVLVLLSATMLLPAMAEQRSEADMRTLASEAINSQQTTVSSQLSFRHRTPAQLRILTDMDQLTLFGYPDSGWAIVSKDDAFSTILGYGDGPVDMSNPSPEFLWILQCFNDGMQQDLQNGTASSRRQVRSKTCSVLREVKPLLKTHWHQTWPYNTKCPVIQTETGNQTCVTGCVATAFAQVLYYLQLPQKAHGKKSYSWTSMETSETTVLSYDFDKNPFDWTHLVASYTQGKSSKAEIDAIGNYVYALGVLSQMGYSPSGSGASPAITTQNINKYFEDVYSETYLYPEPGTHIDVSIVARELNEGRPLVFSGADKNGQNGHCYVIDGADKKGYLHCNLGWGGSGDGYYLPSDMSGYPSNQTLSVLRPCANVKVAQPCPELAGKTIKADTENPVTNLRPNVWYAMWNVGRTAAVQDLGAGEDISMTTWVPDGHRAEYHAASLVRLIPSADGSRYAIQTGLGNYFASYEHDSACKTGTSAVNFTISTIRETYGATYPGYFYILGPNMVRLDCNGAFPMGWNTGATSNATGGASWQFFPVEIMDDEAPVFVNSVTLPADTLRTLEGCSLQLDAEVLPAEASVPYVVWNSSKASVASVDRFGRVEATAQGTSLISASSVDGSGIAAQVALIVGSATPERKLSNITSSTLCLLQNEAGTSGYLVASDTVADHPVLRGILTKSTAGCKDDNYWEEAPLGEANTLWQILTDEEGNYYLWNVGARKFLVNGEAEETEYVFSDRPKAFTVTPVGEDDFTGSADLVDQFYFNAGTTGPSRLMGGTNFLNPAHWLDSTTAIRQRQAVWRILATSGLTEGLNLWTDEAFLAFLHTDGIEAPSTSSRGESLNNVYDLQGRAVRTSTLKGERGGLQGLLISAGKKIIK